MADGLVHCVENVGDTQKIWYVSIDVNQTWFPNFYA